LMALRSFLADVLPELSPAYELDELRAEEQAHQQGRRARYQHPPGDRPADGRDQPHAPSAATSASATSSNPTPRDALTSTTSPDSSNSGTSAAASPASATE